MPSRYLILYNRQFFFSLVFEAYNVPKRHVIVIESHQLQHLLSLWHDSNPRVHDQLVASLRECGRHLYEWMPRLSPAASHEMCLDIFQELADVQMETPKQEESGFNLFFPGQLVEHQRYGYRGLVVDVDFYCRADDSWYLRNNTQPTRFQPWYHVLVDLSDAVTYAAESSLGTDALASPIQHPYLDHFFESQFDGRYHRNERPWPREDEGM
jgi:heat shock protein HspQ